MPKTQTDYSQTTIYKLCCKNPAINEKNLKSLLYII